jgi:very-short-patch-repair endonuclease
MPPDAREFPNRGGAGGPWGIDTDMQGQIPKGGGEAHGWGVDADVSPDRVIGALARKQHGVVARRQLLAAGLGSGVIDHRLNSGQLRLAHRGVYLVGPVVARHAREMAAVLACGPRAVVSHRSAAHLWCLLPYPAKPAPVDVTIRGQDRGRRPGLQVHRVSAMERDEVTKVQGIPVTTPTRTLLDLAAQATSDELEQALAQAERRHLTSRSKLLSLIGRYPRRPGTRGLRSLLERDRRPALTRSKAERRFLALVRKAKLPQPDANVKLADYEVDFLWREQQLVIETDGYEFHSSRTRFEEDRRRDADLAARGLQVMRLTWRQITDEPEATLARVAQALARRG